MYVNASKDNAKHLERELREHIESTLDIVLVSTLQEADFAIVLGGDGTLLRFSQQVIDKAIPVLAVNMGSLGFLTEVRSSEIFDVVKLFIKGEVKLQERYFIEIEYNTKKYYALNEVACMKCELENLTASRVEINGVYLNTYLADGLIVATPTGSTGYSLSAGGPILNLDVEGLIINPLAPHTLSARPIIVGKKSSVTIKNLKSTDLKVICDGVHIGALKEEEEIKISLSDKKIQMILPKNSDYFSVLREKLGWGDSYVKRAKYQ